VCASLDLAYRALSGRLEFTIRRHKFNKDSLSAGLMVSDRAIVLARRCEFRFLDMAVKPSSGPQTFTPTETQTLTSNPMPQTLNPEPQSLNPQPQTLNPKT